jgi:hypothetical protein
VSYTCIGKRRGEHGTIVECANVSEAPSRPDRPEWGYLCPQCLGTQYGRQPLRVDSSDDDGLDRDYMEDRYPGLEGVSRFNGDGPLSDISDQTISDIIEGIQEFADLGDNQWI